MVREKLDSLNVDIVGVRDIYLPGKTLDEVQE